MNISCPGCAARYTANDEKLRGKTARIRCKTCSTVWLVSGPDAGPAVAGIISTPPASVLIALTPPPEDESKAKEESKRAAVVRKGAERETRDLFAEREPEFGSITQTCLPPRSVGFKWGTRNENSVLFSVDQLMSSARANTPTPEGKDVGGRSTDDDGVIDLNALATKAPSLRPTSAPAPTLFGEAPPVTFEIGGSQRRATNKPLGLLHLIGGIAAAAIFLLVTGFGVALAFKREAPLKHTPMMAAAPPPSIDLDLDIDVPPSPDALPSAAPAESVSLADEGKDATEAKDGTHAKHVKGKKSKKGKSRPITVTSKTPVPASKPAKAADPCGCKRDLNCTLACVAKNGK